MREAGRERGREAKPLQRPGQVWHLANTDHMGTLGILWVLWAVSWDPTWVKMEYAKGAP